MCKALKGEPEKSASNNFTFDYSAEVHRCFKHFMKTPRWEHDWREQPEYLDWEEVGKALKKVIKHAELSIKAERPDLAVETAFLILEMDDRQYEEDYLNEREDWDTADLCLDECFELIEKAMDSPKMSKKEKLEICDRLESFHRSELSEYTEYDFQGLIDSVRGSLLTVDEHLAVMMRNLRNESGWRQSSIACEIWDYLIELGRTGDAEVLFREYPQIDALRVKYIDYMQSLGRHEDVMRAVDEGIKCSQKQGLYGLVHQWRERKLQILENRKDFTAAASLCQELFADAHGSEALKYYRKAKELVEPERWPALRDRMLSKNKTLQHYADSALAEIYKEEHLLDRLYNHLLYARFNLMDALSRYARLFSVEQQERLVARLEKEFPVSVGYNSNRKDYQALACRLNTLARTCPAGKELAAKVVNGFRTKYPNRPALMEELAKVIL